MVSARMHELKKLRHAMAVGACRSWNPKRMGGTLNISRKKPWNAIPTTALFASDSVSSSGDVLLIAFKGRVVIPLLCWDHVLPSGFASESLAPPRLCNSGGMNRVLESS